MSLLSVLAVAEHIIYFFVALALIVPIVMLFVSAAMSMLQVSEAGIFQTVLAILDRREVLLRREGRVQRGPRRQG